MKTSEILLNHTRNYRRTKKGVIRNIFSHIKERGIKYNRVVEFDSDGLAAWMMGKPEFHLLFGKWQEGGFIKADRPSIDRKDPLQDYLYSNIQVTTYQFNRDKGDKEKEILWGKPIIQLDTNGKKIGSFPSIKQAVKDLGLHQGLISAVLAGQRNHTGGFKFIYQTPELLTPTP